MPHTETSQSSSAQSSPPANAAQQEQGQGQGQEQGKQQEQQLPSRWEPGSPPQPIIKQASQIPAPMQAASPGRVNAYAMTLYQFSLQQSNPSGVLLNVVALDPLMAVNTVRELYGEDILKVSGPTAMITECILAPDAVSATTQFKKEVQEAKQVREEREKEKEKMEKEHEKEQPGKEQEKPGKEHEPGKEGEHTPVHTPGHPGRPDDSLQEKGQGAFKRR